ncbi:tRNA preQ1(34) S-adenosylmethionine ribosyltransferase-isomerase QueA [soil metagenome]
MAEELQVSNLFFDYDLPERLIAQEPAARRDEARLLVVHRQSGGLEHRQVKDLPALLNSGDLIVRNDTKVLPARVIGTRVSSGGKWEALYLREDNGIWECLAQTRGYAQPGEQFRTDTGLTLELMRRTPDKHWIMMPLEPGSPEELLAVHGHIPLPPYIRKGLSSDRDLERYQTVFANHAGSVAAPTAGLHFTPELFESLTAKQIATANVTLHVGLGTFAMIKSDDPTKHAIHHEWCDFPEATVDAIANTKAAGGRVIAVGTTSTRTLETAAKKGTLTAYRGETDLFIHPPYEFKVIDGLLTNFHLPRTTLLLMIQALCGSDLLKRAYDEAIREEYRFYSYGDAMLITDV